MTGEQLFLRYAFPCADTGAGIIAGQKHRKISDEHLAKLKHLVANNGQPPHRLLYVCFPNAYRRLREHAKEREIRRWALATVADLWRNHHGYEGECRVRRCIVTEIGGNGAKTTVECEGERFEAINIYHLPIQSGQTVYIHLRMVVEIEGVEA